MNLIISFMFLLGIIIGSFLNVCIGRIPLGESIAYPPSHCPKCSTYLKPIDLIPVGSYLLLKGKCRYCGEKISSQYPLIELLNGIIYILLFLKFGWTSTFFKYCIFSSLLMVISLIDYEHKIIPDGLIIFGFIVGAIFLVIFPGNLLNGMLGLLIGGGIFLLIAIITNGAMGGGDIKLMAVLGFWFGWKYILLIMLLSFVLGAVVSIFLLLLKIKKRKDEIPFGPFMALAAFITMYFGQEIMFWYMTKYIL